MLVGGLVLIAASGALFWYSWNANAERVSAAKAYGALTFDGLRTPVGGITLALKRIEWAASGSGVISADVNQADPQTFGEGLVKPLLDASDMISVILTPSGTSLECANNKAFPAKITVELHAQGFLVDELGDAAKSGDALYRQLCLPGTSDSWVWNLEPQTPGVHLLTFRIIPVARDGSAMETGDVNMITVVPAPLQLLPIAQLVLTSGVASILLSPLKRLLGGSDSSSAETT